VRQQLDSQLVVGNRICGLIGNSLVVGEQKYLHFGGHFLKYDNACSRTFIVEANKKVVEQQRQRLSRPPCHVAKDLINVDSITNHVNGLRASCGSVVTEKITTIADQIYREQVIASRRERSTFRSLAPPG
jgi:hypothetical protein